MADWHNRFIELAEHIATWSKDPSSKVGCVIADANNRVVGLGYNGFPRGVADDEERYADREQKYKLVVHAEANAILNANKSVAGCVLYTIMFPCTNCTKMIVQSGVVRVFTPPPLEREPWKEDAKWSNRMFEEAGIDVTYVDRV
jgi:dCMP deaminase